MTLKLHVSVRFIKAVFIFSVLHWSYRYGRATGAAIKIKGLSNTTWFLSPMKSSIDEPSYQYLFTTSTGQKNP